MKCSQHELQVLLTIPLMHTVQCTRCIIYVILQLCFYHAQGPSAFIGVALFQHAEREVYLGLNGFSGEWPVQVFHNGVPARDCRGWNEPCTGVCSAVTC
eukprot:2942119-Amphidinium_carterae.2